MATPCLVSRFSITKSPLTNRRCRDVQSLFRSYLPGFRVGPNGVPGFNIDDSGLPWRANASFDDTLPDSATQGYPDAAQPQIPPSINFSLPGAEGWVLSAPLIGSPGFRVHSAGRRPRLQCWSAG